MFVLRTNQIAVYVGPPDFWFNIFRASFEYDVGPRPPIAIYQSKYKTLH